MNKNNNMTQPAAVIKLLTSRKKSQLTSNQITQAVNSRFGLNYNTVQISKCLNKLKLRNVVKAVKGGTSVTGKRQCYKWSIRSTK
jgi:hypothetical protein